MVELIYANQKQNVQILVDHYPACAMKQTSHHNAVYLTRVRGLHMLVFLRLNLDVQIVCGNSAADRASIRLQYTSTNLQA